MVNFIQKMDFEGLLLSYKGPMEVFDQKTP